MENKIRDKLAKERAQKRNSWAGKTACEHDFQAGWDARDPEVEALKAEVERLEFDLKNAEGRWSHFVHENFKSECQRDRWKEMAGRLAMGLSANLENAECRADEDCDHCVGSAILADLDRLEKASEK